MYKRELYLHLNQLLSYKETCMRSLIPLLHDPLDTVTFFPCYVETILLPDTALCGVSQNSVKLEKTYVSPSFLFTTWFAINGDIKQIPTDHIRGKEEEFRR